MHELQQILLQKLPKLGFTHAQILEALGDGWAMQSNGQLMMMQQEWGYYDLDWNKLPKLPSNISDLSLPEYEETRKQLISLLTK